MAHAPLELCHDSVIMTVGSSGSQGMEQRELLLSSSTGKALRHLQKPDPALAAG